MYIFATRVVLGTINKQYYNLHHCSRWFSDMGEIAVVQVVASRYDKRGALANSGVIYNIIHF